MTRSRELSASPVEAWRLVSDPYGLPRWWPRVIRVEDVRQAPGGERTQWTKVLSTRGGRGVRADYRCLHSTEARRYVWSQDIEGSPFERHVSSAETEILLEPSGAGTRVSITSEQRLRGLSRLGGPMMKGATKRLLDDALEGLHEALEPERGDS